MRKDWQNFIHVSTVTLPAENRRQQGETVESLKLQLEETVFEAELANRKFDDSQAEVRA